MIEGFDKLDYSTYLWRKQSHPGKMMIMRCGKIPRYYYYDSTVHDFVYFERKRWVERYVVCEEAGDVIRRHFSWKPVDYMHSIWYCWSQFELMRVCEAFTSEGLPWVCVDYQTGAVIKDSSIFSSVNLSNQSKETALYNAKHLPENVVRMNSVVGVNFDGAVESFLIAESKENAPLGDYIVITWDTPIAQALLGHREGETSTVKAPAGDLPIEILQIDNGDRFDENKPFE